MCYIISKTLQIRCSLNFWEKALVQFLENRGNMYPWISEYNLPYIFAYLGMQHQNLYGQQISTDSKLYKVLENRNDILFSDVKDSKNKSTKYKKILRNENTFINLQFRFTNHSQTAVQGEELMEQMDFCIDDEALHEVVYHNQIHFENDWFLNLVKKPKFEGSTASELLDIAAKHMQPLE